MNGKDKSRQGDAFVGLACLSAHRQHANMGSRRCDGDGCQLILRWLVLSCWCLPAIVIAIAWPSLLDLRYIRGRIS